MVQERFLDTAHLHSREFNEKFYYDGELGVHYTPTLTTFRLWAPTATAVDVLLMDRETGSSDHVIPLESADRGLWRAEVDADLDGIAYLYRLTFPDGRTNLSPDPYAVASTANSRYSVVLDPAAILPAVSEAHVRTPVRMPPFGSPSDAVIYEAHVRDLTIGPENGITQKGKFLGLTEPGTTTSGGQPTGLDYLASLGLTHIQLLPIYDFGSVDETGDLSFGAQYNWGYDPVNYNVPEGSYATDPHDPQSRIRELKALIEALHARGLRVIMDVVYNHVYDAASSPFELTVPGYFFRMRPDGRFHDGTACGNETASEQLMMRRYIVDSVKFWARVYNIDGFRFDLMGVHDVETMRQVRSALDAIDPSIIILGEGWVMGNHPNGVVPANYDHAAELDGISFFNDSFRDAMKGDVFHCGEPGFVSGANELHRAELVWDSLQGGRCRYGCRTPDQSVIYNEAHDNLTLFDRLRSTTALAGADDGELTLRHTLATSIQLMSQGVAFLHAGQEFLRTKDGDENSYRSPDAVNAFDYERVSDVRREHTFVRDLIAFRRAHSWLRFGDFSTIEDKYELLDIAGSHLAFIVRSAFAPGQDALVAINASIEPWEVRVPGAAYRVLIQDGEVLPTNPTIVGTEGRLWVSGLRMLVARSQR